MIIPNSKLDSMGQIIGIGMKMSAQTHDNWGRSDRDFLPTHNLCLVYSRFTEGNIIDVKNMQLIRFLWVLENQT